MRRAAIAGMILLSCIFSCCVLSKKLDKHAAEFASLSVDIYESAEIPENAASVYNKLRSDWRKQEQLFIMLSGRVVTSSIEESLNVIGDAIGSGDTKEIKKESIAIISKFTEICERNSLKLENLV